ncbi:hypothetical protein ABK040_009851 [Willaertia magna]
MSLKQTLDDQGFIVIDNNNVIEDSASPSEESNTEETFEKIVNSKIVVEDTSTPTTLEPIKENQQINEENNKHKDSFSNVIIHNEEDDEEKPMNNNNISSDDIDNPILFDSTNNPLPTNNSSSSSLNDEEDEDSSNNTPTTNDNNMPTSPITNKLLSPSIISTTTGKTLDDLDFLKLNIIVEEKPSYLKHIEEDHTQDKWKNHQKHFFILSEAGKPIFTRYGDESQLNTIMSFFLGVFSLVQKQETSNNSIVRTINCGSDMRIVFVVKGSLFLVSSCKTIESSIEIAKQLEIIYEQIVFILTSKNIQDILKKRANFDLRNLLGGTDKVIYSLIHQLSNGIDFSFDSIQMVRLSKQTRNSIGEILLKNRLENKHLFTFLVSNQRLVHMIRNKKYQVTTKDILLLMNFVGSAHSSMKSSEIWTPICLPGLSSSQYVYAYMDFFTEDWCCVMICSSTESFFDCQKAKYNIVNELLQTDCFNNIINAIKAPDYTIYDVIGNQSSQISPLSDDTEILLSSKTMITGVVGGGGLRHFVYKSKPNNNNIYSQLTSSAYLPPYSTKKEQKRLCRVYKNVREKIDQFCHKSIPSSTTKTYFQTTDYESVIGLSTSTFELYASFSLLASKKNILSVSEQIKNWVKKEEYSLFLQSVPSF